MDNSAKNPPEQKPIINTQIRKHHMPTWLKIICWTVVVGVIAVCIYYAVVIVLVVAGLSNIANKCNASQVQATNASQQYVTELNSLNIFPQPYRPAVPNPSGDCIDTAAHNADATMEKDYSSPQPLMALSQQVAAGLKAKGFTQTAAPALQSITDPTKPVEVQADYSKSGFPDLTVTYTVGNQPNLCDQYAQPYETQDTPAESACVSQYEASFNNLSAQNVSSVDLEMTKDFPNNY